MNPEDATGDSVLILAPKGRDAQLAAAALNEVGATTIVYHTVEALAAEVARRGAVGLLTAEALAPSARSCLIEALATQPAWSDFPFVVLAGRPTTPRAKRLLADSLEGLGNVTLLERPMHPENLVNAIRGALRARQRQYQARELLLRLEAAVRERDQFLATLSHELRNPLGAIRSAAQVLAGNLPSEPSTSRPLEIVDRQTQHLARLVDDLLDVARVTTGKITLQRQRLDLREVLSRTVLHLEPKAREQLLDFQSQLGEQPIWIFGDPVRLEQVFSNLVTNAIKYTPGPGRIEVGVHTSDTQVQVSVRDTGLGIAPEMLSSVFEMFFQADSSLDRSQGGMGLGLTLAHSLVQLHGGTVVASSKGLGQGSEFTVTLPTQTDATLTEEVQPSAPVRSRRHLLLVEDSADNREMLQELLEKRGYHVDLAVTGLEAVSQALTLRPEAAVIDIGLPGIDGYEVARRVRAALGAEITLVALTGYGRPEDRIMARQAGFNVSLIKPVDLTALEAALETNS